MKFRKLFIIIGLILFIFILSTINLSKILEIFRAIHPFYLFLCFFSCFPVILLSNYQWQVLLKHHNIHIDFTTSLKNIFIGYFYGFITPGGIGGYTRIVYMHDETEIPYVKCFSNIILFNTIDFISLLWIGLIGGMILTIHFPQLYTFLIVIISILSIVFLLVYSFLIKTQPLQYLFNIVMRSSFFNAHAEKLNGTIQQFYEDMPQFRDIMFPFLLSIGGWLLRFCLFYFVAQLFSISLFLPLFIAILIVADIVALIPISIYGLGTREATLLGLFSLFNIPAENVISFSLFIFIVSWMIPSFIGLILAIIERSKKSKLVDATNFTI